MLCGIDDTVKYQMKDESDTYDALDSHLKSGYPAREPKVLRFWSKRNPEGERECVFCQKRCPSGKGWVSHLHKEDGGQLEGRALDRIFQRTIVIRIVSKRKKRNEHLSAGGGLKVLRRIGVALLSHCHPRTLQRLPWLYTFDINPLGT